MIVVNVIYHCAPGEREGFINDIKKERIGEISRAEAGNHAYNYFCSVEDPDAVFLLEKWEDQEVLDAHCAAEHFKKLAGIKAAHGVTMEREAFIV